MHKTLTTEKEIAAYLHRTRMQMLSVLRAGPATLTHIARALNVHPANLSRHIRTLEAAGLVSLVEKRDVGRNLEKWYAAAATSFDVAPEANALSAPHKLAIAFARSDLSAAIAKVSDDDANAVKTFVVRSRISHEKFEQFAAELADLAARFEVADDQEPCRVFHLNMSMYPLAGEHDDDNETRIEFGEGQA